MQRRTKISKYVVNKQLRSNVINNESEKCYSSDDILELSKKIDFPYRKYYFGDSSVKISLERILEIEPIIRRETWTIPNDKIINKIPKFKELYYLLNIVITSIVDHWDYDKIIDYYSEMARIKTPGYGEKYSVYDYWINTDLHDRWVPSNKKRLNLEDIREILYSNIQEARPAYSLISKSLYASLMEFNNKDTYKILDIAAYGERAIAAASFDNVIIYDGVDPNYDLIPGHDILAMDLELLNPNCQIRFIHVGMEDFKTSRKYDIITYSPPPYNTEPYGIDQKTQSHMKYPTFEEYFCCFLTELVYKAKMCSNINTIFSFTALDRNPDRYPPKIEDKKYISDNLKLIYVEALLLVISCFGFQYYGAIGLSAGGLKRAGVPWWVFKYNETIEPFYISLLKEYYPKLFEIIIPRIISNYQLINNNIHPIFEEFIIKTKTSKYMISSFLQKKTNVILELIRYQIQQYVIEVLHKLTNIRIEKIRVLLGRYLMLRSINATYNMPWKSCLYLDPIFPTSDINISLINDQVIKYFIEQKIDMGLANNIVYNYKYWFGSYECIGLSSLYNTIANYIHTIPLSNTQTKVNIDNNNNITIIGNDNAVNILKNIPKGSNICGINNILWTSTFKLKNNIDILSYLRYETLGAGGHQYTRPTEKTKVIETIFNMDVIDIYASIYNNQSETYCSIYPDVEKNSIGSAFCLKMIEGAYLANPVDVPLFIEKSINNINNDLHVAKNNDKLLLISMGFTVWTDTEHYFIKDFQDGIHYSELFKKSDNIGLNILSDSEFILAVYILDKDKFPSILLDKVGNRDNTISVGVLLGSKSDTINKDSILHLVKDKKYIQYIK